MSQIFTSHKAITTDSFIDIVFSTTTKGEVGEKDYRKDPNSLKSGLHYVAPPLPLQLVFGGHLTYSHLYLITSKLSLYIAQHSIE